MNRARSQVGGYAIAMLVACSAPAVVAEETVSFDPQHNPQTQQLADELAEQGVPNAWLEQALAQASYRQEVLDAMAGAAERRLRWFEYRDIFLTEQRIDEGVAFMKAHADALAHAESEYGVPPEV
ncbi:MAG: lytic murein transglycosylase, partial [Pseudomonadota bacterium]|nr:lytic murein transglycosylase [Pseudomonadota bacterium]